MSPIGLSVKISHCYRLGASVLATMLLILAGCATYQFTVEMVEPPDQGPEMSFTDSIIKINFNVTRQQIEFTLTNQYEEAIKIDWQQVYYRSLKGEMLAVYHKGDRPGKSMKRRKPSFIPADGTLEDYIIPVNRFHNEGGIWRQDDLLKTSFLEKSYNVNRYIGMRFFVILSIYAGRHFKEYEFGFEIKNVIKTSGKS